MIIVRKREHVLLVAGLVLILVASACSLPGLTISLPGEEEATPTSTPAEAPVGPVETPPQAEPTVAPTEPAAAGIVRQWAVGAVASSEYSSPDYSAEQATGAPDTPECGDIETAWASEDSDGVDWLEVRFATAVVPTEINIYETHSPGFITKVEVRDEAGLYHTVWEGMPREVEECPRVFAVPVGGVGARVHTVRISLDQTDGYWNEIDAVELVGQP